MKPAFFLAPALLLLTACGSSGDSVIFDTTLGPRTKAQIESLPKTLEGDAANARYSTETLKGRGMESTDGTPPQ